MPSKRKSKSKRPPPVMPGPDVDVVDHLSRLEKLCRERRDVPEKVKRSLHRAIRDGADLLHVEDAMNAFYQRMSSQQQRAALRGWEPVDARPPREHVRAWVGDGGGPCRVLSFEPQAGGRYFAMQEFDLSETIRPITIRIEEGTPLADVLAGLELAAAVMRERWDELMRLRPSPRPGQERDETFRDPATIADDVAADNTFTGLAPANPPDDPDGGGGGSARKNSHPNVPLQAPEPASMESSEEGSLVAA
jgi:hypothetical protein